MNCIQHDGINKCVVFCCARSDLYYFKFVLAVAVAHPRFRVRVADGRKVIFLWKSGLGQGTFGVCYLQLIKLKSLF